MDNGVIRLISLEAATPASSRLRPLSWRHCSWPRCTSSLNARWRPTSGLRKMGSACFALAKRGARSGGNDASQSRSNPVAGVVTREARSHFQPLFTSRKGYGTAMAVRACAGLAEPETIAASCEVLAKGLLWAWNGQRGWPGPAQPDGA